MQQELVKFLERYATQESVFNNKSLLTTNHKPDEIPHRDAQIDQIAKILAPILKNEKPSNLFVYGKTGSGKTVSMKDIVSTFTKISASQNIPMKTLYVNCKLKRVADTEYRLLAQLMNDLGKTVPPTGLPTDELYKLFYELVIKNGQPVVLILDEIDQLTKKTGSEVLYNLTRINEELTGSFITLIGISNDLHFVDTLDPRVKSSLSEEELMFPPYNALQLQDILTKRAVAFRDGSVQEGVVEKCAAYAAREHGDARRAIELMRVAGELADRSSKGFVGIEHVDQAEEKIDRDRIMDAIASQPTQAQAVLYAVIKTSNGSQDPIFTGAVYEYYRSLCANTSLRPLTQRRISDILAELDMLGIITARIISKGRYGRTREIVVPDHVQTPNIMNTLTEALDI